MGAASLPLTLAVALMLVKSGDAFRSSLKDAAGCGLKPCECRRASVVRAVKDLGRPMLEAFDEAANGRVAATANLGKNRSDGSLNFFEIDLAA